MFTRRRRRPRATLAKAVAPVHGGPRPVRPAAHPLAPRLISWPALAMLTVGSVGYLGSAPAQAVFGLASVFLYALGLLAPLGAVSSVAAFAIGFIPPSQFGHSNPLTYAVLILAGILAIGILPPLLMDRLRKPGWKAADDGSAPQA